MKYIIMCGSNHKKIKGVPRQLVKLNGERILDRTIRLLRKNGIEDINVTATDPEFDSVNANIINYDSKGPWINCFYQIDEPVCYIFGDVYFSEKAIEKIVKTEQVAQEGIDFFASKPPFHDIYPKKWAEPFAFKVYDQSYFQACIQRVKAYDAYDMWWRDPIAWELWQVIKNTEPNIIDYSNYIEINDITCDIDDEKDVEKMELIVQMG